MKRPGVVTTAGILSIINGVILLLLGVLTAYALIEIGNAHSMIAQSDKAVALQHMLAAAAASKGVTMEHIRNVALWVSYLAVVIGALDIALGVLFFVGKGWSRIVFIVLMAVALIFYHHGLLLDVWMVVVLVANIFFLYCRPAREYFAAKAAAHKQVAVK